MLTAGQVHDLRVASQLLAGLNCRHVIAGHGYDADALLKLIRGASAKPHFPTTIQRLIYWQRNLVESSIRKIKHFRRIATRFDKFATNFLTAVGLASTRV